MDLGINGMSHSSSSIYIGAQDDSCQFNLRNPNGCFVFLSAFIAIDSVLNKILSFPNLGSIWTQTNSCSAILHLLDWHVNIVVTILKR
ncbi:hypothetical protein NPIL_257821 [Nephila pilipes]|uniref:Uncharacterized protein n=1 Tax=Nephila pilipes TaxID=299642 RepID=A0A8X6NBS0_NEPPI|nr:hypothetical protein NPIL_257821 [Nephila pilipes]